MKTKRISIDHIEKIAHHLAVSTMSWNEPIPPFKTRFPSVLESCVETPFSTYNGRDLYPTLESKTAVLFYLLIKNHPFQNGNKRIAVTSMLIFLLLNHKWLTVEPQKLYNLAVWVAQSDQDLRDAVLMGLKDFIGKYAEPVK
jgi:death-on-curing family protein